LYPEPGFLKAETGSFWLNSPVFLTLPVSDILQSDKQRPYILTVAHGTNSQLALVPVKILTGSFSVYENPGSTDKVLLQEAT
jgi:hypothetical protein